MRKIMNLLAITEIAAPIGYSYEMYDNMRKAEKIPFPNQKRNKSLSNHKKRMNKFQAKDGGKTLELYEKNKKAKDSVIEIFPLIRDEIG